MALPLSECKALIEHALGRATDPRLDAARIVNRAGHWFVGAYEWGWLERPAASLNFAAGQDYVSLPSDFGGLLSVEVANLVGCFYPTSTAQLNAMRTASVDASGINYWGAVTYSAGSVSGPPVPRLEIYPTPAATTLAALTLYYRAGWVDVSADTDRVIIPTFCEQAFIDTMQAVALGMEEAHNGTVSQRLAEVRLGSLQEAMRHDSMANRDYGPIERGASAEAYGGPSWGGFELTAP